MDNVKETWSMVKRLGQLYTDKARLVAAEKLATLMSSIALFLIIFVLGMTVLVFISLFVSRLLLNFLPDYWVYLIIGGFYSLLILVVAVFRRPFIVNPVSRLVSSLLVKPPKNQSDER